MIAPILLMIYKKLLETEEESKYDVTESVEFMMAQTKNLGTYVKNAIKKHPEIIEKLDVILTGSCFAFAIIKEEQNKLNRKSKLVEARLKIMESFCSVLSCFDEEKRLENHDEVLTLKDVREICWRALSAMTKDTLIKFIDIYQEHLDKARNVLSQQDELCK